MHTLDLKVLRDARHLRGQFLALASLVACGVAVFIMLRSMHGYLLGSQNAYYAEYAFADVFAHATRAPAHIEARLRTVPGVDRVYTRIVHDVLLDVPGLAEPATGRLVSLPDVGSPELNRLHLRSGRLPEPGRRDQVLVSAAFATANGLVLGDALGAVLNGRWQRLSIVGTAISPEFIYEISGTGAPFPDNRRFGALWMSEGALATAFEMEGAFNDVVAELTPPASERAVLASFDDLLAAYGGTGAYGRDLHLSHQFVTSEIDETQVTATFFPAVFLLVTAFLLHTTLLRLVKMEREQIGLLKAFGVGRGTVATHYLKLGLLPVMSGALVGAAVGAWLAGRMAGIYARFYQFPEVAFRLDPSVVGVALAIALLTGVTGALAAARSVARLAPAVAMAPPAPPPFRNGLLEKTWLGRVLPPSGRIVARNLARTRWKSLTTAAGIAMSLGVIATLLSMFDAVDLMADLEFNHASKEDVTVYFDLPRSPDAIRELEHLPGVLTGEPIRVVPVRLLHGHREQRSSILGIAEGGELRRIVDARFRAHPVPLGGALVSRSLAELLDVRAGEILRFEVSEGRKRIREITVVALVDELMNAQLYMDAGTLDRLLGEPRAVSGAWLLVDPAQQDRLYARLKRVPGVSAVLVKQVMVDGFNQTIEESFLIALTSTLLLGVALVMAIVYNQTRVALSERGRELASLRVLGFSRREVARLLLGEQSVLVLAAIPCGLALGWLLTWIVMKRFETDLFRLPMVATPQTYLQAVGLVLLSAVLSAFLVRRRLDRIDLIAVLKTRE